MAKIQRYQGNLRAFAADSTAGERTVFGDTATSDSLDGNITSDFFRGWGTVDALSGQKPPQEWFNAVGFTATQLSAYLHQMGIAEWDDEQEHPINGRCQAGGIIWRSRVNSNIGNDPLADDGSNWAASSSYSVRNPGAIEDGDRVLIVSDVSPYTLPPTASLRDGATICLIKLPGLESPQFQSDSGELIKQYNLVGTEVNSDTIYDFDAYIELKLCWNASTGNWEF